MKRLIAFVLILLIFLGALVAINKKNTSAIPERVEKNPVVMASLKPTYSIASALVEGTNISVKTVFPEGLKMEEQGRWFKENSQEFSTVAAETTAVISIKRVWCNDPVFAYTRRHNIRVINIRADEPTDPNLAGVSKLERPDNYFETETTSSKVQIGDNCSELSPFIWMSLSNAAKMAELISLDLKRISPKDAETIEKNLSTFKNKIFILKARYEKKLIDAEAFSVIMLSPDFVYLTENLNIYVTDYMLKDSYYWTDEDLAYLEEAIVDYDTRVVVSGFKQNKKIMKVINETGAKLVILDNMDSLGSLDDPKEWYLYKMEENLQKLVKAFIQVN